MLLSLAIVLGCVLVSVPLTRWMGRAAGWPLAVGYVAAAAALVPDAQEVLRGHSVQWLSAWIPTLNLDLALRLDPLSLVFAMIALLIGAVVFAYSAGYLGPGRHITFYLVMTVFTLSMLGLVLADNLLLLFFCWELTSIASFMLIARSGRPGESASMRTLLLTYVGGVALLVAIGLIIATTGTTSISAALRDPVWRGESGLVNGVAVLVAIAGFSKAAQFPFHVWLPDAMAAPTPVSAYLHAAAVVKAGIFLLFRFSPAFHDTSVWQVLLIGFGLLTALLGARFALEQTDLKRLMAYSTVSQLGLMTATIGVGTEAALAAALLHVIAHALFKSGLFMLVGVIDHAAHTRDVRRLPQLYREMPLTFTATILGVASMAGIPPLLGFVSKESMFTALLGIPGPSWVGMLALAAAALASVMTFVYSAKVALGGFVDGTDDRVPAPPERHLVFSAGLPIVAALPLGLAPQVFDKPVALATDASLPTVGAAPHFLLWHGVTVELLTTLLVFAVGTFIVVRRRRWWPYFERPSVRRSGPEVLAAIQAKAVRGGLQVTGMVRADYASRHLGPIFAMLALVGAGGAAWAVQQGVPARLDGLSTPVDWVLLGLLTLSVLAVCRADSRLAATVSLSAVGVLSVVQLVAVGAPDVGLTQLLVEALTVVVIMLALQRLPQRFGDPPVRHRRMTTLLALGTGLGAGMAVWVTTGRRPRSELGDYFLENTYEVTGSTNVVNLLLVEFRALDTFGEVAVLGTAGVALIAVISTIRSKYVDPDSDVDLPDPQVGPPGSPSHSALFDPWANTVALRASVRLVTPFLVLMSVLLYLRGHNEPGGGFVAALVAASIVGIAYLSTSRDRQYGPPRLPLRLIGGGVLVALATGLWGLIARGSFLAPGHWYVGEVHLTTSFVFDVGVYSAVLGLVLISLNILGTSEDAERTGEGTRERVDQSVEGELDGPMESVRGERPDETDPVEEETEVAPS